MIVEFDGFKWRIETLIAVYWLGNVKRVSGLGTNLLKQVFGPRVSVLGAKETIRASKRIPSMTVIFSFVELFWALWQIPAVLTQFLRPLEYLCKEVASCNDEIGWVEPILANCSYEVTWIDHESCPLQVVIVAGYVAGGGYSHDGFPHPNSIYQFFYSVIIAQVTSRAYLLLNLPTRTGNSILNRSSNSVIRLLRQECFDGERLRGSGLRSWRGFLLRLPHAWRRFALHARRAVALDLGRRTNSPVQNVG